MSKLKIAQDLFDIIYPIGSVYLTINDVNPQTLFGGTWVKCSGGFIVGKRYGIQIILQDANGLLATLTSNLIQITDGKIARDVYQDSNGDYHQGINGMGNDNFTNTIYGSENITDALYINGVKMIWYE